MTQLYTTEQFKKIAQPTSRAFRGKTFEEEILLVGQEYWRLKIAFIQRFEVPKIFKQEGLRSTIVYQRKAGYDFIGSHFYGENRQYARSLYVEAKSHRTMLGLPFLSPTDPDQFGVKAHQLEALAELEARQCECYILFQNSAGVFKASTLALRKLKPYGCTIYPKDYPEIWKPVARVQGVWVDFLEALK